MIKNPRLHITWAKAFGEIYCHHASLHIPYTGSSLFPPELIQVGITVRTNIVSNDKINGHYDNRFECYLPCRVVDDVITVQLNSTSIVENISMNSWTTFKSGERKSIKSFPIDMSYRIADGEKIILPFAPEKGKTPVLVCEHSFDQLTDTDMQDNILEFDSSNPECISVISEKNYKKSIA